MVGKFLILADKGGRVGLDPPFLVDIMCKQPLTVDQLINLGLCGMIIDPGQENYSTHASHYSSLWPNIEQYITLQYFTVRYSKLQLSTIQNSKIHQITGVCIIYIGCIGFFVLY